LVTGSLFALVFAGLAPITALGSLADSRFGAKRLRKREGARFSADVEVTRAKILEHIARTRADLIDRVPSATRIRAQQGADPRRWHTDGTGPILVALGSGDVDSNSELARPIVATSADSDSISRALDELNRLASVMPSGPVVADARHGVGIVGPPVLARAVARGLALQVAWALSPTECWCRCSASNNDNNSYHTNDDDADDSNGDGDHYANDERTSWFSTLPHRWQPEGHAEGFSFEFGRSGESDPVVTIAVARSETELPRDCAIVIAVSAGASSRIVHHPDRDQCRDLRVEPVSSAQAGLWALAASKQAALEGSVATALGLPDSVPLTDLLRSSVSPSGRLSCEFAVGHRGPLTIDLVEHGPHAVIGGTTGSGKSELLIAWVLSMASGNSPDAVNFLLIDFKGGSAFAGLAELPHTVGVITDLDAIEAARALASLRAELRFREATLVRLGARSIEETATLPRLVIIVDEFAAMLAEYPDLHSLFSDISARGRSLGVHLILCTQRPAGAVRDAVLANADLRISLRVNNRADSSAVVGTDEAAGIPASARGRGVVAFAGHHPRLAQFAMASDADVAAVVQRWSDVSPPRRPWCDPLPTTLALADIPDDPTGMSFGLLDLPHEQRHALATWRLERDGHLLVLGAPGSGKSTVLNTLASRSRFVVVGVPPTIDGAWDCVVDLVATLDGVASTSPTRSGRAETLVVLDDLDSLLARFSVDYRQSFVEQLTRLARDGAAHGLWLAMSAQRLNAEMQGLASVIPARLFMRHSSRQDFVLAGGEGTQFVALPTGGAAWLGNRAQVAVGAPEVARAVPRDPDTALAGANLAIVSTRVSAVTARLHNAGYAVAQLGALAAEPRELLTHSAGKPVALVGDVDEWQSRWGALAALRPVATLLFDACGVADYRAITRSRELPPPLPNDPGIAWRWTESGTARRFRMPG
jgi:S-DNA-T family DNA segregation ATPase FtsK/SpoIIIE